MQTFLTDSNFQNTAITLDYRRLGKQRVEAWQILRALTGETKGWVNHPATKMWRGYEFLLCQYGITMCVEWESRGYKDTMLNRFAEMANQFDLCDNPWWLDFQPLITSHRSNLYRKDPIYYQEFAYIGGDLPYVWCEPDGTWKVGK